MGQRSFAIKTIFKIVDRITAPIKRATRSVKRFKRVMQRSMRAARISVLQLTASIKTKLLTGIKGLAFALTGLLAIGLAVATAEFVHFDQAITNATAKFGDLAGKPKETIKAMNELRIAARAVGADTQFTATQAGKGLEFLAQAGFTSKQAIAALRPIVDLATAGTMDLEGATDVAAKTLGAFGLMTKDSAQLTKNLTRVNDVMAKSANSASMSLTDMFEAVKAGGPDVKAAGFEIETFGALVIGMAKGGKTAEQAGTAIRNIFLRLAAPVPKAAKMIKKLGIEIKDNNGNFRDIIDVLGDFEAATKSMGKVEKAATLDLIFGKRAITATNILLGQGTKALKGYRTNLKNAGGEAARMAADMRKGLLIRLEVLKSGLIEVGFKFIDVFAKQGGSALETITKAVQKFDPTPIALALLDVGRSMKKIFDVLVFLSPVITTVVGAFIAYKTALIVAAAAQMAFNAILTANPIGIVIVAVAALVGGIILLVKHWDAVTAAVNSFIDTAVERFPVIKTLWDFSLPGRIVNNWEDISLFFRGLWGILKIILSGIAAGIKFAWDLSIPGLIVNNWESVKSFFVGLWNLLSSLFEDGSGQATGFMKVLQFVGREIIKTWEPLIWVLEKATDLLGEVISGIGEAALGTIRFVQSFAEDDEDEDDGGERGALESSESLTQTKSTEVIRSEIALRAEQGTSASALGKLPPGVTLAPSGAF